MSKMLSSSIPVSDTFYIFEKKWVLDLTKEGLSSENSKSEPEILYSNIYKDLFIFQVKHGKNNELFSQNFPPTEELRPYQTSLKNDSEVIFADKDIIFVNYAYKGSLDIIKEGTKIGNIKGKLKHAKILKSGDRDAYLMVISQKMIEITINIVTGQIEETQIELPCSEIYDFEYFNEKLYVLGYDPVKFETILCWVSPDNFPKSVKINMDDRKLRIVKINGENNIILHNGVMILYSEIDEGLCKITNKILIPLTRSGKIKKINILDEKHILLQDNSHEIRIFSQDDPTKNLLISESIQNLNLLINSYTKSIYSVEIKDEIMNFYELTKIGLLEYMKNINTYEELKPMMKIWLNNSETKEIFYKIYIKDNLDNIVDLPKIMRKITNIQLKISLMQDLNPKSYEKLQEYIKTLTEEIEMSETGLSQNAFLRAVKEFERQLELFMTLNNGNYSQKEYIRHKQKSMLDLISEHIVNDKNIGLICTAYVNKAMLDYDKILEKIVEFEMAETPKGPGDCTIEKMLPLGKNYDAIIKGSSEENVGTFAGYWEGVRQRLGEEEFNNYSRDYTKYFKAIKYCFAKTRKNISKFVLKYLCIITECGTRRGIENLDLLKFDFKTRDQINLPPPDKYNIDQASTFCSEDTFNAFITQKGTDHISLLKGMVEFHRKMLEHIDSKAVTNKEFFKLLEKYLLKAEIKVICGILAEINENKNKIGPNDPYAIMNENKPQILEISLKHIYTQENASHVSVVTDLYRLLLVFMGDTIQNLHKEILQVLSMHIEIAEIVKKYGLHEITFKEICKLSELEKWKNYVETIGMLINERIDLKESGKLLMNLQEKIINEYSSTIAKTSSIFSRDNWKTCLQEVQKLHVFLYSTSQKL